MSRNQASTIKRLQWRLEWLAQGAAAAMIAKLPGVWVFRIGEGFGHLLWVLMSMRRRIVVKNLRIVFAGGRSLAEVNRVAHASFVRSIANLFSAVYTASLPAEELASRVRIENPELLEAAVSRGNGCLLLPSHMGNWELLSRIGRLFPPGHALGALYRPLNNPYLDERLAAKRQSEGTRMFSKRDSLLEISRFLKGGGIMGVLADQRVGPQGVVSNFFGRLTRSSPLPELLIRRCKVPAFSISVRTERPGRWVVRYHEVAAPGDTQACMNAIEAAMRVNLVDVFWFQDRWKLYLSSRKLDEPMKWLGDPEKRSARSGHRALIWLVGLDHTPQFHEAWHHPDVHCEWVLAEKQPIPAWIPRRAIIHRIIDDANPNELHHALRQIDEASELPVDFVVGMCENHAPVGLACSREAIEFILHRGP